MLNIATMPKIELHCHLDGSLGPETAQQLLHESGRDYTLEELTERMRVPEDCTSLAEYLTRFEIPVSCIQTAQGLKAAAYDLAKRAAAEHIVHLEVRFAPTLSYSEGLGYTDIIESVEQGLARARTETGISTGIIVCAMRHMTREQNMTMFRAARELYGSGVVAFDLAGDEASHPIEEFRELFELARKLAVPFTIHAGETGRAQNIRGAIEYGAKRIGHGIAMSGDERLMNLCAERRIGIEMCPTSNIQTHAISDFHRYPLQEFLNHNIAVTVNTDNMTASNTTSTDELRLVRDTFGLEDETMKKLYRNAAEVAFTDDNTKNKLLSLI